MEVAFQGIDLYSFILNMSIIIFNVISNLIKPNKMTYKINILIIVEIIINIFLINEIKYITKFVICLLKKAIIYIYLSDKINSKAKSIMLIYFIIDFKYIDITNFILNAYILNEFGIKKIKTLNQENTDLKYHKQNSTTHINIHKKIIKKLEYIKQLNDKVERNFEKSDVPMILVNDEKKIVRYNENFADIFLKDNKYLDVFEFIKSSFKNSYEVLKNIKNGIGTDELELYGYNEKIYKLSIVNHILDDKIMKIFIFNDITTSYITKKRLESSEERYKDLMDIIDDGVIIHDNEEIDYINNKAIKILGLDMKSSKLDMSDIKDMILDEYEDVFRYNDKNSNHRKIKLKNNLIVEVVTNHMKLSDRTVFISMITDLTDLYNTINKLEEDRYMYQSFIHNLPQPISIIDKENMKFEYKNKYMSDLINTIGKKSINKIIEKYISSGDYGKFRYYKTDSSTSIYIALVEHYEEDNYVVVARVIDENTKVNKLVQELNQVKNRYNLKTEFLNIISKDLRNPINSISSTVKSIDKKGYESQYINKYTKLVNQNINRLIRILDNIDEIENIDKGSYKINLSLVNINYILNEITTICNDYSKKKNINITFKSSLDNTVKIYIDEYKFIKVILNILSNSIKFTDSRGKIMVHLYELDNKIHISIEDNGKGIPKDKLGLIFKQYEQVDRTLSRGAEGTGLGLSLVDKMSKLNNWDIALKSEEGIGSEFILIMKKNNKHEKKCINIQEIDLAERVDIEFSDIYYDEAL